jgi:hypothetical protein
MATLRSTSAGERPELAALEEVTSSRRIPRRRSG